MIEWNNTLSKVEDFIRIEKVDEKITEIAKIKNKMGVRTLFNILLVSLIRESQ